MDALRAIMMMLGVVLHTVVTYGVTDKGEAWPLSDPLTTHIAYDFIVLLIHAFRMPIFFLVAGFFGALLYHQRGLRHLMINRVRRLILPFVVFLTLLWPLVFVAFTYTTSVFNGVADPLSQVTERFRVPMSLVPEATLHLWFLYYLIQLTSIAIICCLLSRRWMPNYDVTALLGSFLIRHTWLRVVVCAASSVMILIYYDVVIIEPSLAFTPDLELLLFYGFFYLVGWCIYRQKDYLVEITTRAWTQLLVALIMLVCQGLYIDAHGRTTSLILMIGSAVLTWLFVWGFIGLFIRYTDRFSPLMRYISDASYWVYLVHLPIAAFLPGIVHTWPIGSLGKCLVVIITTTIICFVSYHYLVRSSWIGQLLNGHRYHRSLPSGC